MKLKLVCCLLLIVSSSSLAQLSREEKIEQLKSRTDIKVTEVDKDILKLEYLNGKVLIKNIGDYKRQPTDYHQQPTTYSPTFDSTIIDLTTIDTALYYQKYSFWQEVSVGTVNTNPPLVGDVNKNELAEIYGIIKDYNSGYSDVVVMELNTSGGFDSLYSYDSTGIARRAIYDIDNDEWEELYLYRFPPDTNYPGSSYLFFKKTTDSSLATDLSFIFYPFPENNQFDQNTFGDWDGDELIDQTFIRGCCPPTINLFEYNPLINNFDSVYQYDFSAIDHFFSGFAIGDINQNGKTEFFSGSVNGKVIAIENCGDNCYNFIWQGSVETNNAYLYAVTNDLDDNGKPEVWIGGDAFYNGVGITRITIFEANGNNSYQVVGKIDLVGVFSFYASNMKVLNVDKKGKDEIMICIDQHVIILKFNGSLNHHTYEVFYIKRNDLAFSGRNSVFYGATMYDITGDEKEDIIIHLDDIITNVGMRLFTYIYKADFSVDVNEPDPLPEKFHLYPNYPNPFNPATNIRFEIPEHTFVSIKVYNVLGKEVRTLLDKELPAGEYTIEWDGKDSNGNILSSGVYFIRMLANPTFSGRTDIFQKTINSILIK